MSSYSVDNYLAYKECNPETPLNTYNDLLNNYSAVMKSNLEEAEAFGWKMFGKMKYVMIYELTQQCIDEKDAFYKYEYKCTYDPTGNKLGCFHYLRKEKPISASPRIYRVLGSKIFRYYVGHYDSDKQKEQMKKYKEYGIILTILKFLC